MLHVFYALQFSNFHSPGKKPGGHKESSPRGKRKTLPFCCCALWGWGGYHPVSGGLLSFLCNLGLNSSRCLSMHTSARNRAGAQEIINTGNKSPGSGASPTWAAHPGCIWGKGTGLGVRKAQFKSSSVTSQSLSFIISKTKIRTSVFALSYGLNNVVMYSACTRHCVNIRMNCDTFGS